jgi:large subunit ribosomal protein L21
MSKPSTDFAIIKTGGKQYRVAAGSEVVFDQVLLRATGGKVEIGKPIIAGAKVEAKALIPFKEKTKIVFKYHAKARYKKKKGHRQPHTEVQIVKI